MGQSRGAGGHVAPKLIDHLREVSAPHAGNANAEREADPALVAAALAVIPNPPQLAYDEWKKIGMAAWSATRGSEEGFSAFDGWSSRWSRYDAADTRKAWDEITGSPPDRIGAGTLFHRADQADPNWREKAGKQKQPPLAVVLAQIAAETQ